MERVTLDAIGVWHSPLTNKQEAPRQGSEAGHIGEIEIDPRWAEGLIGIKPGAHIWVLSYFNRSKEPELFIHPKRNEKIPKTGLFNTRSPNRPAPVAMTLVEVLSVEENRLSVKGVDALEGTPVLDIKPHVPKLDRPRTA